MLHPDIKIIGEDILKNKATSVVDVTPEIYHLIEKMYKVMHEANGIGLAANQIGSDLSIFVTKMRGHNEVFINPTIIEKDNEVLFTEGCLSIPGVRDQTKRFNRVVLTFQTPEDMTYVIREEFEEMCAFVVQHEVDHLNGKLYLDNFNSFRKSVAIKKCNKVLKLLNRR